MKTLINLQMYADDPADPKAPASAPGFFNAPLVKFVFYPARW